MKKRILTMILSALLLTNATACNVAENGTTGTSENTTTNTTETTTTTTSNVIDGKGDPGATEEDNLSQMSGYTTNELVERMYLPDLFATVLKNIAD